MSEQKYYVQINRNLWNNLNPLQLGGVGIDLCQSDHDYGEYFIAEYEPESSYAKVNKNSFTKTELAEIMDGALYTQTLSKDCVTPEHVYYGSGEEIVSEWINPLIELVPVEDDE